MSQISCYPCKQPIYLSLHQYTQMSSTHANPLTACNVRAKWNSAIMHSLVYRYLSCSSLSLVWKLMAQWYTRFIVYMLIPYISVYLCPLSCETLFSLSEQFPWYALLVLFSWYHYSCQTEILKVMCLHVLKALSVSKQRTHFEGTNEDDFLFLWLIEIFCLF